MTLFILDFQFGGMICLMPVWTFLEEYDLSGKTVIPFFSHNGSSSGANSVNRVTELAKGANVLTEKVLFYSRQ